MICQCPRGEPRSRPAFVYDSHRYYHAKSYSHPKDLNTHILIHKHTWKRCKPNRPVCCRTRCKCEMHVVAYGKCVVLWRVCECRIKHKVVPILLPVRWMYALYLCGCVLFCIRESNSRVWSRLRSADTLEWSMHLYLVARCLRLRCSFGHTQNPLTAHHRWCMICVWTHDDWRWL